MHSQLGFLEKLKKSFFLVPACIHITRQRAEEQMLDQDVAI